MLPASDGSNKAEDQTYGAEDGTVDQHSEKFGYVSAEGLTLYPSDDPDAEEFYLG